MPTRLVVGSLVALICSAAPAFGQLTVSGSAGSGWQPFPGTLNNYSNATRPYWDQDTLDGSPENRNVGNYMNNTWTGGLPGGSSPSPNITPVWWGRTTATDYLATQDLDVRFLTPNQVNAAMRLELAGYSGVNQVGWYNTSDPVGSETLNLVFNGPDSPPTGMTFTPSSSFGLWIRTGGGHLFFSQAARNRNETGSALSADDLLTQHFAIFGADLTSGNELYYVGAEDLPRGATQREIVGDYNDMIFTLRAVPTPGAAALLGLGGLALGRRRR